MKLLILTQYYPPEIGAPQNRLHELAIRLKATGMEVEVLTALPNYPGREILPSYKNGRNREEIIDGISVHRSGIYVSRSNGIVKRLLNYFSFVWTSYHRGKKLGKFDFLMVESPPLFLGYSAIRLSKKLKARLIFNVSDLWPESAEKLGIVTNKYLLKLAYQLEAKCYKEAYLVTGQTQGIVDDIASRFPSKRIYYLPNGVDTSFYDPQKVITGDFRERNGFQVTDFLIFYGGILGHAQGLEVVLNAANLLKDQRHVHFILQGTGPEHEHLLQLKAKLDLKQVHFFEPVQKQEMPSILKSVDVAIIPLKKLLLFEGAIPSKVYEALAMKKPLLLGVSGEAKRHFIDKAKAGLYFEPENHDDLARQIMVLVENPEDLSVMGENARNYVSNNFDRDKIAKDFLAQLV